MVDIIPLAASQRTQSGKGPARAARRAGMVPAVIYGNKLDTVSINVERKELERQIHVPGFFIRLIDVNFDGASHRVLPRDVQFHPVSDAPLHVDFLRFSADHKITVEVPVQFLNEEESPGLKRGGVLNIVRHEVEVLCTADNIPQIFEIDLTGFDIGDAVHASTVALPEGVTFTITDRDFTIATVAAPTVVAEEAAAEGEEGEEIEGEEGAVAEGAEGEAAGEESETKDEG
jgi:large subunit ribosomal protein L25